MAIMALSLFVWHGTVRVLTVSAMAVGVLVQVLYDLLHLIVGQTMGILTKHVAYFGPSNKNMAVKYPGLI
jgi:hypothetical protein